MNTLAGEAGKSVGQVIREIFLDDLDMPAEHVIEAVRLRTGVRCDLEQVLHYREDVEKRIARAMPTKLTTEPSYFTNRPRLVTKEVKETMMAAKKGRALVDVQEKRRWLNDWALEKGGMATIKEAKEALNKQFGEALGTSYIATTLKDARQLLLDERRRQRQTEVTLPPAEPVVAVPAVSSETPLRETVKSIAALMRISGIRKIAIEADGSVSFEASTAV